MKSFPTSSLSNKMVYIWLSEYTINTAGEVYHKSGILDFNFNKDSKGVSTKFGPSVSIATQGEG